jgi:hypothetical protein
VDLLPFIFRRCDAFRFPGAAVPVGRIAGIACSSMQIGVNPCRFRRIDVLNHAMRLVPITRAFDFQRFDVGIAVHVRTVSDRKHFLHADCDAYGSVLSGLRLKMQIAVFIFLFDQSRGLSIKPMKCREKTPLPGSVGAHRDAS